jgi:ATP-dependent DNA helicase RecG
MPTTIEEFRSILEAPEGLQYEFKEAARRTDFTEMLRYIVAIANEGGGKIVFGVTDKRPRRVTGTTIFPEPGETESSIEQQLHNRVPLEEFFYEGKRLVLVHIPGRLPGTPWDYEGQYLRRSGDSLAPLTSRDLRAIFAETATDFSNEICPGLKIADLDTLAIGVFRERWARNANNPRIGALSNEQVLADCGLIRAEGVTNAALILLGTPAAVDRFLPHAEVVFEYRSREDAGPAQDRVEFREGFLLAHDKLWERINLRNDRQSYQDGFFRTDISTFDELVAREAVLNAVCHRDYRLGGSIFVRQYARRLEVVSPGGFPTGITIQNLLDQQSPRNLRLASACLYCGLVERAGQGMNLMFERSIRQSKALPDFHRSSEFQVFLVLEGTLTNWGFLRFIERIGQEQLQRLSTAEYLVLDSLQREQDLTREQVRSIPRLIDMGLVERVGRGRGTRYFLSRSLYDAMGEGGVYTRRKGLDREANKALLLQHIREAGDMGAKYSALQQVTPALSRDQIWGVLRELRDNQKIIAVGKGKAAKWISIRSAAST